VLSNPTTWDGHADYTKGALVAGEIDRRLRAATDGAASLATVLRELNEADEPVTNDRLLDTVEAAAAEGADDATAAEIRDEAERLTTTRATTETWDRDTHAAAFGETPAQVGYGLADDGVRATGEYRNRTVARDPVELVVGESLEAAVVASNTGGATGSYDLSLSVDGEPVANRSGALDAGAETIERFEHRFDPRGVRGPDRQRAPDCHRLRARAAARPGVSTDRDRVPAGESVVATATVGNDASVPAGGEIEFRVGSGTVATVPVRLDAGTETTIEREVTFDGGAGPLGVGRSKNVTVRVVGPVDEASTTVAVESERPLGRRRAGFGPAVALVSVIVASAALARRGRRGRNWVRGEFKRGRPGLRRRLGSGPFRRRLRLPLSGPTRPRHAPTPRCRRGGCRRAHFGSLRSFR